MGMFGMFGKKTSGIDPVTGKYGGDMVSMMKMMAGMPHMMRKPMMKGRLSQMLSLTEDKRQESIHDMIGAFNKRVGQTQVSREPDRDPCGDSGRTIRESAPHDHRLPDRCFDGSTGFGPGGPHHPRQNNLKNPEQDAPSLSRDVERRPQISGRQQVRADRASGQRFVEKSLPGRPVYGYPRAPTTAI